MKLAAWHDPHLGNETHKFSPLLKLDPALSLCAGEKHRSLHRTLIVGQLLLITILLVQDHIRYDLKGSDHDSETLVGFGIAKNLYFKVDANQSR